MNTAVICFCIIIGLIVGGLIWWIKRSIVVALLVPIVAVLMVAIALPPPAAPIGPGVGETATIEVAPEQPTTKVTEALPSAAKLAAFRPVEVPDDGYVASDACRDCHPHNHATWFASYHRTMTQVELLLGPSNAVQTKRVDAIMNQRDDTPMTLAE